VNKFFDRLIVNFCWQFPAYMEYLRCWSYLVASTCIECHLFHFHFVQSLFLILSTVLRSFLVHFVSSILANVWVRPKFSQSRRNSIAPSHLTCLKLRCSSGLHKLSWLWRCKFLLIKGFEKCIRTNISDVKIKRRLDDSMTSLSSSKYMIEFIV